MEQIYCSVSEIIEDLGETGLSEARLMAKIQAASQEILRSLGQFLPAVETKYLPTVESELEDASADGLLHTPPLLSVSTVSVWGTARSASNYKAWPFARHWPRGPYSALQVNDDRAIWGDEPGSNIIAGTWGMYDEAVSVSLSAISQNAVDTTLTVSDGSQVSPGMVLKIDSEWELVTGSAAPAASGASLAGALDDASEEVTITNGSLVNAGETLKVDFEQMRVLDVASNVLQVARGVNGSKRASHTTGSAVKAVRVYNVTRGANGSTAAAHTIAAVYRQVAPADVNYLCRQMACLMIKKAQTGYVGRGGNDEMGTGFWVNEFPKNQIETVKSNYFWGGY